MSPSNNSEEANTDSIQVRFASKGVSALKNYQPFWMIANQNGRMADRKSDIVSEVGFKRKHYLGKKNLKENSEYNGYLEYGIDLLNNDHFKKYTPQQAYLKAGFKNWEIRFGRFYEIIGENDQDLSSGSLGTSGNALPIPKFGFAVTDYTVVPFSNGWLQFKGLISHGWMGQNQYLKDAYLHEKTFYMRLGKNKLKLYGGVQHYAIWGGGRDDWRQLDRNLKGFLDVLLVKEADDGSLMNGLVRDGKVPPGTYIMKPNKAGDHRGVVEGGFEWENDNYQIKAYHQTPFDMGIGISFRNIDKLLGLTFLNKIPEQLLRKITFEFLHTKQMTDWVPKHRESYYNNGIYKTGWEYEGYIIGTPLFLNRIRASKYFNSVTPYNWDDSNGKISGNDNIMLNRVVSGHTGVILQLSRRLYSKTLLTYTRYYNSKIKDLGTVSDQMYSIHQFSYLSPIQGLTLTGSAALDYGGLTKNLGYSFGFEWLVNPSRKHRKYL